MTATDHTHQTHVDPTQDDGTCVICGDPAPKIHEPVFVQNDSYRTSDDSVYERFVYSIHVDHATPPRKRFVVSGYFYVTVDYGFEGTEKDVRVYASPRPYLRKDMDQSEAPEGYADAFVEEWGPTLVKSRDWHRANAHASRVRLFESRRDRVMREVDAIQLKLEEARLAARRNTPIAKER